MRATLALPCGHLSPEDVPPWPDGTEADISCPTCGAVVHTTVDHGHCFCGWTLPDDAHRPHQEAFDRFRARAEPEDPGKALAPVQRERTLGLPVALNSFVAPGESVTTGPDHPDFPAPE